MLHFQKRLSELNYSQDEQIDKWRTIIAYGDERSPEHARHQRDALKKAADAGHADAMVVLGTSYVTGDGCVEQDRDYGIKLLHKAKSIGTTPPEMADMAMRMLGVA